VITCSGRKPASDEAVGAGPSGAGLAEAPLRNMYSW
jgi:hypothetical protein